jgi:RNA polymerase sigma-70 factor (ECF subfamily)
MIPELFDGAGLVKQNWASDITPSGTIKAEKRVESGHQQEDNSAAALALLSDEGLMDRVGAGDERAYQVLAQRHLNPYLGMAQRLVGDRQDAEDIMQEAFVRLWRFAPRWQASGARFTTWYYRVIMNLCIDHKRKAKSRPPPARSSSESAEETLMRHADDGQPDAEQGLVNKQRQEQVLSALSHLPERQRIALEMCYFQGLANKEAAAIMDVNIKALESLLVRGRRKMADLLGTWYEENGHG